jgi:hypothetical protein
MNRKKSSDSVIERHHEIQIIRLNFYLSFLCLVVDSRNEIDLKCCSIERLKIEKVFFFSFLSVLDIRMRKSPEINTETDKFIDKSLNGNLWFTLKHL